MALASRVLRIQPGERRIAGLVVGLAFVAMTSFTLGERAVDALSSTAWAPRHSR